MNFLIHHFLDQYALSQPDSDAVSCLGEKLSYLALWQRSNSLANFLIQEGVTVGERVGIYLDKSLEMSVALYGIMKAGAAYVPLDPNAPAKRLSEIIQDCDIDIIVTGSNKLKKLSQIDVLIDHELTAIGPLVEVDSDFKCVSWDQIFSAFSSKPPDLKIIESDLAYIIYTSGSTGSPKGIMHTHHSGLSYAKWAAAEYQLTADDRLGNHSPLHFDISIFDWFAGLVCGACTIIIPDEFTKFPASYSQLISDTKMTVLFTVPFALIQLSARGVLEERDMRPLRWIIFGGEPFPIKHLRKLMHQLPNARFDNMYGPAEINGCTHYTVGELASDTQSIPIGHICQIAQALVVDASGQPVAIEEQGELLVRTPTMMQGYWGRQDLNEKAFYFHQPFAKYSVQYQHRFYRTGDLVKQTADGNLWFLGRKDRQVKVRGYRVELDEIEATLVAYQAIEEAAVYAVRNQDEPLAIHASYTVKDGHQADLVDINQFMKNALPSYALPIKLLERVDFPRTTSGKINRNALTLEVSNDTD